MFYAYCREYYPVWEPAEGGYYVTASRIVDCVECDSLEEAYEELLKGVILAEQQGDTLESGSWFSGFETYDGYSRSTYLVLPWFRYNDTGYYSDGYVLEISIEEPKDEPYTGYC